jgi:hypothetical protein
VVAATAFGLTFSAAAATSTSDGRISTVQVMAMLEQAESSDVARQVLVAYMSGVGETAALIVEVAGLSCERPLGLDRTNVLSALAAATGPNAGDAAATPLIVDDLMKRAGCRR